ncbi:PREDICTED: peroxidase 29 [Camelina sativa]|uniref:Peroxidase n=1 Tax=Camelina sativa TaxID=90675 RepID=A0ABM0YRR8_CAMSA|nr:PREDICTED: peroxidase 29 [Camelina sativa]
MKPKSKVAEAAAASCVLVIMSVLCTCINGDQMETNYEGTLSYSYYEKTCPKVEEIVRSSLSSMFILDPTSPAALLRLMFHDCQVQGCDASILLEPSGDQQFTEIDSVKNFGIRKRDLIGSIKTSLETECPKQVSCSDVIILAAREAVALSGGPLIAVPLGRKDSLSTHSKHVADSELPPSTADVDTTLSLFAGKGMTVEESVAIMGSHTIGVTHCNNVLSRFGDNANATSENMDPRFQTFLRVACPELSPTSQAAEATFVPNDQTAVVFDTAYYDDAIAGRGNLRIDSEIGADPRTRPFAEAFAADQDRFFNAFSSAFVKLSSYKVLTGNEGIVRSVCDKIV